MAIRRRRQKHQPTAKNLTRINDNIRVPEIRLVGDNIEAINEELGSDIEPGTVYRTHQALNWAREVGLDLIEISGMSIQN